MERQERVSAGGTGCQVAGAQAQGVSIVQVRKGDGLDRKGSCGCTKRYIKLLMNWAGGTGQEVKRTHDS